MNEHLVERYQLDGLPVGQICRLIDDDALVELWYQARHAKDAGHHLS